MDAVAAVRMAGIAKRFGAVQALRGVDFALAPGEIHALLGENGAGKTTLMHVLFGLTTPDAGTIELDGTPAVIAGPGAAMARGLGMVHQHFTLVAPLSVAENVWLGRPGFRTDRTAAAAAVLRVGDATGLRLDPAARAGDLPVGLRQRLEIVKALAREVRVLILDEPTAALTPREVDDLFAALRRLASSGVAIVLITHKLREVLAVADRVTVLRRGATVLSAPAAGLDAPALARAMIGERPDAVALAGATPPPPARRADRRLDVLTVAGLTVRHAGRVRVKDAALDVRAHEIVGIAAVEGNGQRELLRAIAGLTPYHGAVTVGYAGRVGFVPEDRQREGLVLDFSLEENLALGRLKGLWLDRGLLENDAALAIEEFGIRAGEPARPVRTLSGGNQQKVVLARVLAGRPSLLIAENPTRGLDVHATTEVHERLRRAATRDGVGVLFHSTDLDEVLALSDRVGVMADGRWTWVADDRRTREGVGALMLGAAG